MIFSDISLGHTAEEFLVARDKSISLFKSRSHILLIKKIYFLRSFTSKHLTANNLVFFEKKLLIYLWKNLHQFFLLLSSSYNTTQSSFLIRSDISNYYNCILSICLDVITDVIIRYSHLANTFLQYKRIHTVATLGKRHAEDYFFFKNGQKLDFWEILFGLRG